MLDVENSVAGIRTTENPLLTTAAYIIFGLLVFGISLFMLHSVKLVRVQTGEESTSFFTFAPTVRDVVKEAGITGSIGLNASPASLKDGEKISYYTVSEDLAATVRDGMKIRIYHNTITKKTEDEIIAAPVERKWNIYLNSGQVRVVDPGKNGMVKNTYLISYRDGVTITRQKIGSSLVTPVQKKIIETGTYEVASRQGSLRTGRPAKFVATAYTYTGNRTATGAKTRHGIVAVDPRVIPLGTRMYIEGYGYGVAADTGGFIKGRRIDVFLTTDREVDKWGRRTVNVYFLGE